MLCRSSRRWKFQRRRIGKLAASVWCFSIVCSATTSGLAARIAASSSRLPRCSVHRRAGSTAASQSTTRPSIANSSASNAPITAVQSVMARMYGRSPSEQAQRNAKKFFGGASGADSG